MGNHVKQQSGSTEAITPTDPRMHKASKHHRQRHIDDYSWSYGVAMFCPAKDENLQSLYDEQEAHCHPDIQ